MAEFLRICLLFLVLRRVSSGVIANITKYACIGDSTDIFQRIPITSPEAVITLFKNGEHNDVIAMWTMVKSGFNETFKNGYSEKVLLDKYGNLRIRNLRIHDEGKYTLQIILGSWTAIHEVQLFVLVPPVSHCKPKIIRSENTLIANLETDGCGKPSATVYWLEHSGISYGKNVIKLQTGNEVGTYHACIEGPALKCTHITKLSDFCEVFRVEENKIRPTLSGAAGMANTSDVNSLLSRLSNTTGTSVIHSTSYEISGIPTGTVVAIICASIVIPAVLFIAGSVLQLWRMNKMKKRLAEMNGRTKQIYKVTKKLTRIQAEHLDDIYEPLSNKNDPPQTYLWPENDQSSPDEQSLKESLREDAKDPDNQVKEAVFYEANAESVK